MLTSRRESRLEFDFTVRQTPQVRMRTYLTVLQTGRDEAKEVRVFGLAAYLRRRFDGSIGRIFEELAGHLRRRSILNIAGNLGSAVVFAATLFLLVWLISQGRISIAAAGAAIVAVRLLAGQLQAAFGGVQAIFESGLFIDDLDMFLAMEPSGETGGEDVPPEDFQRSRASISPSLIQAARCRHLTASTSQLRPGRSSLSLVRTDRVRQHLPR